ncbi:hypothetical protein phiGT1_28 [Sulfitobacter phage phiGT1]|nr:hypothetical protein phiGT1_28 [Sulfitobacter phage phiGT1]
MTTPNHNALGTIGFGVVFGVVLLVAMTLIPPAARVAIFSAETQFFPVVGPASLYNAKPVDGGCEVSARASKFRSCPWRKTIVYLGSRSGINVPIEDSPHREPPILRDVGSLEWERIFIPLECTYVSQTFADAFHECRGADAPLTRSKFWERQTPGTNKP